VKTVTFPTSTMGKIHGSLGVSRRSRQQPNCSTRDSIQSSHRREMARFCDDGVCICRHPSVLLPPAEGTESYKDGNRSTTVGMNRVE